MFDSHTGAPQDSDVAVAALDDDHGSNDWASRLIDAYLAADVTWPTAAEFLPTTEQEPAAGLLDVIQPVLVHAKAQLKRFLEEQSADSNRFVQQSFITSYLAGLPVSLLRMLARTLVLELHVARLEQRLNGATPEDRYQDFLNTLRNRETALDLLSEYPVLAEQIQTRVDQWLAFGQQFIRDLLADWPRLRQSFPRQTAGPVVGVQSKGDRHRGGRSVLIVRFATGQSLVYKPKPMAVDVHFQQLITWLNHRGLEPPLRPLTVLDRDDHGWVEFVEPSPCQSEEEVQRHYQRQGNLLALTYLLGGTDFHFENILADGEHPVLIDLEALFHPESTATTTTVARHAGRLLDRSVLGTGLLPQPLWGDANRKGIDLSGLAAVADQPMPFKVPAWDDAGTDQMRFVRKTAWFAGGKNRLTLRGQPVDPGQYVEHIDQAFHDTCQLFMTFREPLLADDGPLRQFAGDTVRVLLRSTRVYGELLSESFHPDLLRDAAERDQLFDQLHRICSRQPEMRAVVPAEIDDLREGDVPLLTLQVGSRNLAISDTRQIPDFFARDGLTSAIQRLREMNASRLQQQRWILRASLTGHSDATVVQGQGSRTAGTAAGSGDPRRTLDGDPRRTVGEASCQTGRQADDGSRGILDPELRQRLVRAADRVGRRLGELAIEHHDAATWLSVMSVGGRQRSIAPLGVHLYDGLAGVALFLAHWGAVSESSRGTRLAELALAAMRQQAREPSADLQTPGAFAGRGGVVYCLTHLAALWQREELLHEALTHADELRDTIARDSMFDLIGGCAGGLVTLLNLHRLQPREELLRTAIRCGDRLLAKRRELPVGVAWPLPGDGAQMLTGFSHGVAGIAWALLKLSATTGDTSFRKLALEALRYERSTFRDDQQNWPDFRTAAQPGTRAPNAAHDHDCAVAWCHGAPGIGLGRLATLPYLDEPMLHDEIKVAIRTTLRHGFGHNHSLCHGDLGNIELLLSACLQFHDTELQTSLARRTSDILESIERDGWQCGTQRGLETPGLMTGLAGIGYQLLRLADPTRVPSILTLELPNSRHE